MPMKKEKLLNLIKSSPTAFNCVDYLKNILKENKFQEVVEQENWELKNTCYFTTRNDASLIAFKIPPHPDHFQIITTHCDTPSLELKPAGENVKEGYLKYNIMPYGGLLNYGWLDHPLSLAGRVFIKKKNTIQSRIIDFEKTVAVVPSVAIHQNDKANSNLDLNMQTDLQPILNTSEQKEDFSKLLKDFLKLKKEETLCDYDLFFYNNTSPQTFGQKEDLLLSPRIDNLTSVSAAFESFLESDPKSILIFCTFNNEEIGSLTIEGADGSFLLDTLKRITTSLNIPLAPTLAKSFIISSDNTHAPHPNHPEYMDATANAYLGKGFAIVKESSSTTNGYFSSLLKELCHQHKISYQDSTAKNDLAGGSTLSGISLRHVSVTSIDVGIPELAMHSSLEVCSLKDYETLYQMMKVFYQTNITITKKGTTFS